MTLEQEIRDSVNTYEELFGYVKVMSDEQLLTVIADRDGVLKVELDTHTDIGSSHIVRYLNGDKFYPTHEEAFQAEL